jgi:hypothetical protein
MNIQELAKYATPRQLEVLNAVLEHGSQRKAGIALGINKSTVQSAIQALKDKSEKEIPQQIITIPQAPPSDLTADELIAHKIKLYERKKAAKDFNELINIKVKGDKPIAVCLIGDPHIDDDGCDIVALKSDLEIIERTEGMFAGHVGDLTNNWVGRLARLYANQTTTAAQALTLMEWMLNKAPNLFVIGGNHDCWNNGMDLINFVMRSQSGVVSAHGARIALNFDNGRQVRLNARHDFRGHSMYHPLQGHIKAQHFGGEQRDHVYLSGHKHIDGALMKVHPQGKISWAFIISGYKIIDEYADEGGFTEQRISPSVTIVINPKAENEAELIKPFWDAQAAADYLKYLRA